MAKLVVSEKNTEKIQEALEKAIKSLEVAVEPPPIEDTLEKAKAALKVAAKLRQPVRQTWYCTDCGGAHIQNDGLGLGLGHINVDCLDGDFVDPDTGKPLTGPELQLMDKYAAPKADRGEGHCGSTNRATRAKMKELKGVK